MEKELIAFNIEVEDGDLNIEVSCKECGHARHVIINKAIGEYEGNVIKNKKIVVFCSQHSQ